MEHSHEMSSESGPDENTNKADINHEQIIDKALIEQSHEMPSESKPDENGNKADITQKQIIDEALIEQYHEMPSESTPRENRNEAHNTQENLKRKLDNIKPCGSGYIKKHKKIQKPDNVISSIQQKAKEVTPRVSSKMVIFKRDIKRVSGKKIVYKRDIKNNVTSKEDIIPRVSDKKVTFKRDIKHNKPKLDTIIENIQKNTNKCKEDNLTLSKIFNEIQRINKRIDAIEKHNVEQEKEKEKEKEKNKKKKENIVLKIQKGNASSFLALRAEWIPTLYEKLDSLNSKLDKN